MNEPIKNRIVVILLTVMLAGFSLGCILKPAGDISLSERRPLAQFPELSLSALANGSFMSGFEAYATDQFPLRDAFRTLRAYAVQCMGQSDSHGIYLHDGYAAQIEYPLNTDSLDYASQRFQWVYDRYLAQGDHRVLLSVIPDKGEFLGEVSGHPALDYEALSGYLSSALPRMEYVEISDLLDESDYYRSDTHWRQEKLSDVADRLAASLGVELTLEYECQTAPEPFLGVYAGQSAFGLAGEELHYLTHPAFDEVTVINHETGTQIPVYDTQRLSGSDPYEVFLSGPLSLITVENPNASTDRELILFRDSFGSAIAPYFIEAYEKITLVDIRYLPPHNLGYFIEFSDQDVLFLYSTLILNHSETIK